MDELQSSFGIKKIVDCKIGEGGKQMYKVKWEPTWEPAENLASCKHLIDKFWSYVNKAKTNEDIALQHRKKIRLASSSMNDDISHNFLRMSEDEKTEVQKLIAQTNTTSVGNQPIPPSNILASIQQQSSPHNLQIRQQSTGPIMPKPNFNSSGQTDRLTSFSHNNNVLPSNKVDSNESSNSNAPFISPPMKCKSSTGNAAALKYIENFENPYVKIVLVCKICNREQSLKFSHNWKKHYLSHVSDEEKPHKCPYCPKAFVTAPQIKKHLKSHENIVKQDLVKKEVFSM